MSHRIGTPLEQNSSKIKRHDTTYSSNGNGYHAFFVSVKHTSVLRGTEKREKIYADSKKVMRSLYHMTWAALSVY